MCMIARPCGAFTRQKVMNAGCLAATNSGVRAAWFHWLSRIAVLFTLFLVAPVQAQTCDIASPLKIGVGAWSSLGPTQMDKDLAAIRSQWHYDWGPTPKSSRTGYVPMIWSPQYMNYAKDAPGKVLLTFNEPDNAHQANLSVTSALSHWPTLMATGKRLGSPAVQTGNEIGSTKWLGQFMAEVKSRNYRVDFIAVHYYTTNRSVLAFKNYLISIRKAYNRPIWITEWALADWANPGRFSVTDQTTFFQQATEMMDDLTYVERHAWFGLYDGMDGWDLNSGLVHNGARTPVGNAFRTETLC